jgi:hypothetical protein
VTDIRSRSIAQEVPPILLSTCIYVRRIHESTLVWFIAIGSTGHITSLVDPAFGQMRNNCTSEWKFDCRCCNRRT